MRLLPGGVAYAPQSPKLASSVAWPPAGLAAGFAPAAGLPLASAFPAAALGSGFVAALPAGTGAGLAAAGFVPAAGLAVLDGCASAGTAASARAAGRRNRVRIMSDLRRVRRHPLW